MADPYIGEIRLLPYTFAPYNWMDCDGTLLPLANYQALFAIIGTAFGGNGTSNFALPNLQGAVVPGVGDDPGDGFDPTWGQKGGSEGVTLTASYIPQHNHTLVGATQPPLARSNVPTNNYLCNVVYQPLPSGAASITKPFFDNTQGTPTLVAMNAATLSAYAGQGQAHENRQPFLALRFCICVDGVFPSRS